jgi:hypothetical protein
MENGETLAPSGLEPEMTGARPISGDFGRWGQIHGDFMGQKWQK